MPEKLWYIKNCGLFEQLGDEELRRLDARCRSRALARNHPVYLPADAADTVYLLAKGRVKICHLTGEGKQSILGFVEPGEIFGELAVMTTVSARDEYAEAIEPTTIISIPDSELQQLMAEHPGIAQGVLEVIGQRRIRIERRLKNLLFLSNRERVTHLLLDLAEQYGRSTPDGIALGINLSHQELANLIGSTRETVTVVLGELQNEGLIRLGRRKVMLTNPMRLSQTVRRDPPAPSVDFPSVGIPTAHSF